MESAYFTFCKTQEQSQCELMLYPSPQQSLFPNWTPWTSMLKPLGWTKLEISDFSPFNVDENHAIIGPHISLIVIASKEEHAMQHAKNKEILCVSEQHCLQLCHQVGVKMFM